MYGSKTAPIIITQKKKRIGVQNRNKKEEEVTL